MTWRQQLVVKILLMVARMFTDDPEIRAEIKSLATSISVSRPSEEHREP